MTHICIRKLTDIGSDNSLLPVQQQAIILTNAGILLIGTLGINLSEILIEIYTLSSKKVHLKMLSGRWWQFCLGLNVLNIDYLLPCSWNVFVCFIWCWYINFLVKLSNQYIYIYIYMKHHMCYPFLITWKAIPQCFELWSMRLLMFCFVLISYCSCSGKLWYLQHNHVGDTTV